MIKFLFRNPSLSISSVVVILAILMSKQNRNKVFEIIRSISFSLRSPTVSRILVAAALMTGVMVKYKIVKKPVHFGLQFFASIWVLYWRFYVIEHAVASYKPTFFNVHLVEKAGLTRQRFAPVFWAYNKHAQSVVCLALAFLGSTPLNTHRETFEGFDESPQYLDWLYFGDPNHQKTDLPIILMVHGLGDDNDHPYMRRFALNCQRHGWRAVAFSYWRCDFGETRDLAMAIDHLRKNNPHAAIISVAWSAGGNILLKYLGEVGKETPVVAALIFSGCFDFLQAVSNVRKNENQAYRFFLTVQVS
jgi:hypothetical protein